MRVSFVGGGTMGEAIVSALLNKRVCLREDIRVSDAVETRRQHFQQMHGVFATAVNVEAVQGADVIVLAVKPQNVPEVMADLAGHVRRGQLVLSIMAGVKISALREGLKHDSIVRCMPNTPAQIGEGMTVWTATPEVTEPQKHSTRSILGVLGKEVYVDDEKMIDIATAVSGSGPAYFFLFLEALADAAVSIGMPRDMGKQLALQTMLGAGHLVDKSGREPADLRRMVTSKGGTTAEALQVFEEGGFNKLVERAVAAAYRRARILGGDQV
ncbi:MAG: pyrroline-5-carboxylate reductase [Chloroflexi bacterium RBG_16_57_8]|nr:MAG: pyrroline-5-carboxylate reductase [Chloroflexi bacterium RBG_16_57_8]